MKKAILAIVALATYSTLASADFPAGLYKGHGSWKDDKGNTGTYDVQTTSTLNSLDNVYNYSSGVQNFKMDISGPQNGFFDVSIGGQKGGEGYCMTVQCHYTLTPSSVEESIVFSQGHLYRVGSKTVNGTRIGWEEDLQQVSAK